ncbi:MAG: phosphatidylglycerophosphatase A [Methanobacterium sp.]
MKTKFCIEDIKIRKDENTTIIYRDKGFQVIGNSTIGLGIEYVDSIVYHGLKNRDHPLPYTKGEVNEEEINQEKSEYLKAIYEYKGVEGSVAAILSPAELIKFHYVTKDDVTAMVSAYNGEKLFLSIIVFVDQDLDPKTLIKLFKSTIDSENAAMWDMGVINHFSFDPVDLEDDESILIASKGSTNIVNPDVIIGLIKNVQLSVREAVNNALRGCGFPKDVLEYMNDVGVGIDDLVDAGMELVVGVEETPDIRDKLKKQIYHSLEDLNVVSYIIAGIRLEEDYEKHRVRGVDVDDDPAYLYSDEVFGMSVANQIAGTKAIFNFKRYDEAKPGIIGKLGPVLDDVFAGLVAGCMSKIFEV